MVLEPTLDSAAKAIPSMGGRAIRETLRSLAMGVPRGSSIVEVGSWLGSSAAQMCLGVKHSGRPTPLHLYDIFEATADQVDKAARQGVSLTEGADTLLLVRQNLAPFGCDITFHKGDTKRACVYDGGPIGLYVDDASKKSNAWDMAVKTFFPHLVEGAHVVLMDYYWGERAHDKGHSCQRKYMESHSEIEFVKRLHYKERSTCSAVFRRKATRPTRYEIVGVVFDTNEPGFDRMLRVFERSVTCNAPQAKLRIIHSTRPVCGKAYKPSYPDNTRKLHVWRDVVEHAECPTVLLDVDTIILRELLPAFGEQGGAWDVGITVRPHAMWINAGAIYCRPTQGARDFMGAWVKMNDKLYRKPTDLYNALKCHNGLNQTAMLHMIEQSFPASCAMVRLPCVTWNNCDQTWCDFDLRTTAVLHIKGGLRKCALGQQPTPIPENMKLPLKVWDAYDVATK